MYKKVTGSLVSGCRVAEELIERYGPDMTIRQRSDTNFLAQLRDGQYVEAVVLLDGSLSIRELEVSA